MADWLKKQADREAEKEQRRLERIQRKLAEPKHYFTDTDYEQQCHELQERLEDSVLKGYLEIWIHFYLSGLKTSLNVQNI